MNTTELVHYVSTGERPRPTPVRRSAAPSYHEIIGPLRCAILRARNLLLSEQLDDGSWLGHLAGDVSLASQFVLVGTYLGRDETELIRQAANSILDEQLPSGGWPRLPGGGVDLSVSVQAYFSLKVAGYEACDERLSRARGVIRQLGGADAADRNTRQLLALFGQISYDACPSIFPERLLISRWAPNQLRNGQTADDQRRWLASLAIVWSHRPAIEIALERGVRELFIDHPGDWRRPAGEVPSTTADAARLRRRLTASGRTLLAGVWRRFESRGWTPLRRRALDLAEADIIRRTHCRRVTQLDFQELLWHLVALDALGFAAESREMRACSERLVEMIVVDEETDTVRPRFHTSAPHDTALILQAIRSSGIPRSEGAMNRVARWLLRSRRPAVGSQSTAELAALVNCRSDAADHANVVAPILPPYLCVGRGQADDDRKPALTEATHCKTRVSDERLVTRLLQSQNGDGGWNPTVQDDRAHRGSYHLRRRHLSRPARTKQSDSVPDVTGAVLDALATCGRTDVRPTMERAIAYLRAAQRADGSWSSTTGVRFVHGTSFAICGLIAAGIAHDDNAIAAGINWLLAHQQPSGGWGETAPTNLSHEEFAPARPTASQTAWALLALVASGRSNDAATLRGIQFLLDLQDDDGRWHETQFTLRDTARGHWLTNDLHAVAWPLLALSRWAVAAATTPAEDTGRVNLRLVGTLTDD